MDGRNQRGRAHESQTPQDRQPYLSRLTGAAQSGGAARQVGSPRTCLVPVALVGQGLQLCRCVSSRLGEKPGARPRFQSTSPLVAGTRRGPPPVHPPQIDSHYRHEAQSSPFPSLIGTTWRHDGRQRLAWRALSNRGAVGALLCAGLNPELRRQSSSATGDGLPRHGCGLPCWPGRLASHLGSVRRAPHHMPDIVGEVEATLREDGSAFSHLLNLLYHPSIKREIFCAPASGPGQKKQQPSPGRQLPFSRGWPRDDNYIDAPRYTFSPIPCILKTRASAGAKDDAIRSHQTCRKQR